MRNRGKRNISKRKEIVITHVKNNIRLYAIVVLLFLIGLVLGTIFVNHASQTQIEEVTGYLNEFVTSMKTEAKMDRGMLLKDSLISNFILAFTLWFVGSTVIGIPIVYGMIAYRGFCLGYTISSVIATLGLGKGILFILSSMLLQNIILIPCILALAVSGVKLYQAIVKDKQRKTIRSEITRHTMFSIVLLVGLECAAFIEVYLSSHLLQACVKFL